MVLVPYNAQLRAMEEGWPFSVSVKKNLQLATIDSFQGQEAEIVILSMVRCNCQNSMGFLAQASGEQRMNVALTRARSGLVVVGDAGTLGSSPVWFDWLQKYYRA